MQMCCNYLLQIGGCPTTPPRRSSLMMLVFMSIWQFGAAASVWMTGTAPKPYVLASNVSDI